MSNGAPFSISSAPRSARQPSVASAFTFSGQRRVPASDPRSTPALVQLNAVTSQIFTGIGRSPVPVLLPFDTAAFLDARANGAPASLSLSRYQADFRPVDLFDAGQAGYDAVFSLEPGAGDGMPQRTFAKPVEVQITGSILTYDINDPLGGKGEPVKTLQAQFPDLRRFIREGYVRYAFTRFGVPYVVSIQCLDSVPRERRLACREAYPVAERFLKALRIAGGQPSRRAHGYPVRHRRAPGRAGRPNSAIVRSATSSPTAAIASRAAAPTRPPIRKSDFRSKKRRPSSVRNRSASATRSINRIRPAIPGGTISAKPAVSRSANAPAALAIRARTSGPAPCSAAATTSRSLRSQAAGGCRRPRWRRDPLAEAAGGDAADQHRQRAHPVSLHAHEPVAPWTPTDCSTAAVSQEGEKIGVVSNYLDHPNGTTRHLHFDVQVFTRDGWLWVNPYVTLISAYERLIRGRGREIGPEIAASPAVAHALPEDVIRPDQQQEGGEN